MVIRVGPCNGSSEELQKLQYTAVVKTMDLAWFMPAKKRRPDMEEQVRKLPRKHYCWHCKAHCPSAKDPESSREPAASKQGSRGLGEEEGERKGEGEEGGAGLEERVLQCNGASAEISWDQTRI